MNHIPLETGLNIVGRMHLEGSEWVGKFANFQNDHVQEPKNKGNNIVSEKIQ